MRYISEVVKHSKYNGTGQDPKGNDVESWAAPVDLGIYAFNPGVSSEPFVSGHDARVVTEPCVYAPPSAQVSARDRLTVRGVLFEVDGDPLDFRNPYGSEMDGLQINLRAVEG